MVSARLNQRLNTMNAGAKAGVRYFLHCSQVDALRRLQALANSGTATTGKAQQVMLFVEDNGPGVDEALLPRLTMPFEHASRQDTPG